MSEVDAMRLEAARQLHRQGRLHEAEVLYREVLKAAPPGPDFRIAMPPTEHSASLAARL